MTSKSGSQNKKDDANTPFHWPFKRAHCIKVINIGKLQLLQSNYEFNFFYNRVNINLRQEHMRAIKMEYARTLSDRRTRKEIAM